MRVLVRRTVVGSSSVVERPCELCLHGLCFSLLPGAYHGRGLEELLAVVSLAALVSLQVHLVDDDFPLGLLLSLIRLVVRDAVKVRLVGAPLLTLKIGLVLERDVPLAAAALPVSAAVLLDNTMLRDESLHELDVQRVNFAAPGGRG